MTIGDFILKLRKGYKLHNDIAELIVEEYDTLNIDWQATYNAIKSGGGSVTHIGAIETKLVYSSKALDSGITPQEQARLDEEKYRRLHDPDYLREFIRKYHPWYNVSIYCDNLPQRNKLAHVTLDDLFSAMPCLPECSEKELVRELYRDLKRKGTLDSLTKSFDDIKPETNELSEHEFNDRRNQLIDELSEWMNEQH
jgi:hypothetical protein